MQNDVGQALTSIDGFIFIMNNKALTDMAGAFGQLMSTRLGISMTGNALPTSMNQAAFPQLMSMGGPLEIVGNSNLATMTCAFTVRSNIDWRIML